MAAAASGKSIVRSFRIAGYEIQLRFAGPAMVPTLTRALEHLAAEPSESPDLTICLWDSASTRTPMIPPPWGTEAYGVHGLIDGFDTDRFRTLVQLANNTLKMLDHERSLALYWIPDAERVTYYESISPLRTVLAWWMSPHGRELAHAAAVGTPDGGVLLPARGGSGKSTTALTCLEAGLRYAGDNNVLLETDARPPRVHGLYSSTALHGTNLRTRLPHLWDLVENPDRLDSEKAFAFLHARYPRRLTTSLPLRSVLVPRVTGRTDTRLVEGSAVESLRALIPSTVFSRPGAGPETVERLTESVRSLPHYTLELGTDLSQIPRVILDLLRELG